MKETENLMVFKKHIFEVYLHNDNILNWNFFFKKHEICPNLQKSCYRKQHSKS